MICRGYDNLKMKSAGDKNCNKIKFPARKIFREKFQYKKCIAFFWTDFCIHSIFVGHSLERFVFHGSNTSFRKEILIHF